MHTDARREIDAIKDRLDRVEAMLGAEERAKLLRNLLGIWYRYCDGDLMASEVPVEMHRYIHGGFKDG